MFGDVRWCSNRVGDESESLEPSLASSCYGDAQMLEDAVLVDLSEDSLSTSCRHGVFREELAAVAVANC